MIGIAITTRNRPDFFYDTLQRIRELTPHAAQIVVVDDASDIPVVVPPGVELYRFQENAGIAAAKNKCLELLEEGPYNHWFLFDDDTYPVREGWYRDYVASQEPHLAHQFVSAPSHWRLTVVSNQDPDHVAYDKSRGCMLYVERRVVEVVGGFHTAFGKHGGEHEDFSRRIHEAGFTRWKFAGLRQSSLHCRDQVEKGISSVKWSENQQWRTVKPETLPSFAPYRSEPPTEIPVLVPRRDDHGWRDQLWSHVQTTFWNTLPGFRVVEGHHTSGVFSRSAAVNKSARIAGEWDVAVIADSDSLVDRKVLLQAVQVARETGRLVAAFDRVAELTEKSTIKVLEGDDALSGLPTVRVRTGVADPTLIQSTMLVVPRVLWDKVGGFDERFVGWGGEDNAFWKACTLHAGEPVRLHGAAYHLWHPEGRPESQDVNYQNNLRLWKRYNQAKTTQELP